MAAAIVGSLIGSVGVVAGVLLGQSLQSYGRARARATALARETGVLSASLFDQFRADGTLPPGGWGPDYYRFGLAQFELVDCCEEVVASRWGRRHRRQFEEAIRALNRSDAMWGAAQLKLLDRGESLTKDEINSLILAFGSVGRVLRPGATTDVAGYLEKLRKETSYFIEHGIDADPADVES